MGFQRLLRILEDGTASLLDLWPSPSTAGQRALGQQFVATLHDLIDAGTVGEGSPFWATTCRKLARLASEDDPLFFMRWEPIRATMVHGATPSTVADWWMLRRSPEWRGTWAKALAHKQFGHPPPFIPMLSCNAMTIEHASHLYRFRQQQGQALWDADCIVEFGGGYGSMGRLIHALGFRGTYIIFDLPPILSLQRYYLALNGIESGEGDGYAVRLCSDLEEVRAAVDRLSPENLSIVSTWALSEMPIALRERIEPFLHLPCCTQALLSYQATFEGTDNRRYFSGLMNRTATHLRWTDTMIGPSGTSHTPTSSYFAFGTRR